METGALFALFGLGALHGINPAMGWLFAVALGLQERKGRAVWRALPPLALGHAISITVVVAVAVFVGQFVPATAMRWGVAIILLAFALHRLRRGHRHPRYGGMRVGPRQLVVWSFLMATAHGAGLMVLPFLVQDAPAPAHHTHAAVAGAAPVHVPAANAPEQPAMAGVASLSRAQVTGLLASAVHALGYLLVTCVVATVVYRRLGLRLLRTAWINLDIVWAAALILTAVLTPLL